MRTSEKRIPGKLVKRYTGRKLYFSMECYGAMTEVRLKKSVGPNQEQSSMVCREFELYPFRNWEP